MIAITRKGGLWESFIVKILTYNNLGEKLLYMD